MSFLSTAILALVATAAADGGDYLPQGYSTAPNPSVYMDSSSVASTSSVAVTEYPPAYTSSSSPVAVTESPYTSSATSSSVAVTETSSLYSVSSSTPLYPTNATAASDVYVTQVVTALTTVCPSATILTIDSQTYTVESSTTLTITSCAGGCTVSSPVSEVTTATTTACTGYAAGSSSGYFPYIPSASITTSSVPASSSPAVYEGEAARIGGSAALLVGVLGLIAL